MIMQHTNARIVLVGMLLTLFVTTVCALTPQDIIWNGALTIKLDTNTVTDTQLIHGVATFANTEDYPLLAGNMVLHVATGKYEYPSQFAESDNVVYEQIVPFMWLLPHTTRIIDFNIPAQPAGTYRLDMYAWVGKSKFIGASNIFFSPVSTTFSVTGTAQQPNAYFIRELLIVNKTIGPVGFPIQAGDTFSGTAIIYNPAPEKKSALEMRITICEWASAFCEGNETVVPVPIPAIESENNVKVPFTLKAPLIPSAYEINFKLYNGTKLESLYKSRVIVTGGTAKIRKILMGGLDTNKYSFTVLLTASPDHFTTPSFEDFSLRLDVFEATKVIETKTVDGLTMHFDDINEQLFKVQSTSFDKVCVSVIKTGNVYDKVCFDAPLAAMQTRYFEMNPSVVTVTWKYVPTTGLFDVTLTKEHIDAQVRIFSENKTLLVEQVDANQIHVISTYLPKENLFMTVDDFEAKRQKVFTLNFAIPGEPTQYDGNGPTITNKTLGESLSPKEYAELPECTNKVCASDETCSVPTLLTKQGACCAGTCVTQVIVAPRTEDTSLTSIPFIFWVAIVLAIIAVFMAVHAYKKVMGRKK